MLLVHEFIGGDLPVEAILKKELKLADDPYSEDEKKLINAWLADLLQKLDHKIIVIDDDPTGGQTVNDIMVYTSWSEETLLQAFEDKRKMFYIMTNSRSMTEEETAAVHKEIVANIVRAAKASGKTYLLISRGDSTLRGHYPLETQILYNELSQKTGDLMDGELIIPFFKEGGRFTIDDVHYYNSGNALIPVGQSEFANDRTFGFKNSNLKNWIEEKTKGTYPADNVKSVSLSMLRLLDFEGITKLLLSASSFDKIVVNSTCYTDLKVFAIAFLHALQKGKKFLARTAAGWPKVLGDIQNDVILTKEDLVKGDRKNGGLIVVGSHVKKTTEQLERLKSSSKLIVFIEFNQHLALEPSGLEQEILRVADEARKNIKQGVSVAIFTRRKRIDMGSQNPEEELIITKRIADAVTDIVRKLDVNPRFIIVKGGITSSDIAVKALHTDKALILGQAYPGIPVWKLGENSKYPGIPYIVFPGNVGDADTLKNIAERLID